MGYISSERWIVIMDVLASLLGLVRATLLQAGLVREVIPRLRVHPVNRAVDLHISQISEDS